MIILSIVIQKSYPALVTNPQYFMPATIFLSLYVSTKYRDSIHRIRYNINFKFNVGANPCVRPLYFQSLFLFIFVYSSSASLPFWSAVNSLISSIINFDLIYYEKKCLNSAKKLIHSIYNLTKILVVVIFGFDMGDVG